MLNRLEASPALEQSALKRSTPPPPRFGGGIPGIYPAIQFIEENPMANLAVLDLVSMIIPRGLIEWFQRKPEVRGDAVRETLFREVTANITNVFMVGTLGALAARAVNQPLGRLQPLNPKGIPPTAHIDYQTLEHFGQLFKEQLKTAATPQELREGVVRSFLDSLRASDASIHQNLLSHHVLEADVAKQLRQTLTEPVLQGELSQQAKAELSRLLTPSSNPYQGAAKIWEPVLARLEHEAEATGRPLAELLQDKGKVAKEWLRQSQLLINADEEKAFLKKLVDAAHDGGLAGQVHILHNNEVKLANQKLDGVTKKFKYFLEHYLDPLLTDPVAHRGSIAGAFGGNVTKEGLEKAFFGGAETKNLFQRLLPRMEEGLVPYTRKLKRYTTFIPLALTVAASMSLPFINNWMTKRKYGGALFFPGEGLRVKAPNHPAPNLLPHPVGINNILPTGGFSSLKREDSPFRGFTEHRLQAPTSPGSPAKSPVRFGGGLSSLVSGLEKQALKWTDFEDFGVSSILQNQVIYGGAITSRGLAAAQRDKGTGNELREVLSRDPFGWFFWYYACNLIQQGLAKVFVRDQAMKDVLLYEKAPSEGFMTPSHLGSLRITSPSQLDQRKAFYLKKLEETLGKDSPAFQRSAQAIETLFTKAKQTRLTFTAVAFITAAAILGIGIPALNVFLTNKNSKNLENT